MTIVTEDSLPSNEQVVSFDDPNNKAMQAILTELKKIAATATTADLDIVRALITPGHGVRIMSVTPAACAVVVLSHNRMNRAVSPSKIANFIEDMKVGDWKTHHQGIAFTSDSKLGDGQHRLVSGALSGLGLNGIVVYSDFDIDSIDAIDRSTRRTAAQSMAMKGVEDADDKAPVARALVTYLEILSGIDKPRISDQRLERELRARESLISTAVRMGKDSVKNVTEPALRWKDAAIWAAISLSKGWDENHCTGFLAAVQQGVGAYHDSPTILLSKRVHRAKNSEKRRDKLSSKELIALSVKAASMWAKKQATAQLVWNEAKEGFPDPTFPKAEADNAAASAPPTLIAAE